MFNNLKGSSADFGFIRLRDDLGLPPGIGGKSQALAGLSNEVHTSLQMLRRVIRDGTVVCVLEVDDGDDGLQHFRGSGMSVVLPDAPAKHDVYMHMPYLTHLSSAITSIISYDCCSKLVDNAFTQ